jgi:hypothetical protein
MSLPLFASYPIKHVLFSQGYFFVVVYTWGLIAVLAVPVLLAAEVVMVVVALRGNAGPGVVRLHAGACCVATAAEVVFLYVRSYG